MHANGVAALQHKEEKSMVIQHNMAAMNANRMLGVTTGNLAKNSEKLSSGYRINRAADDAAGLSISEKMRKQIRGLNQASSNAEDGISAVQTAEGALTEVHSMLQRMNELAVQASNGTMSEDDRQNVQDEIDALTTEIDRVSATTKFNETYLLKGKGVGDNKNLNVLDNGTTGVTATAQTTVGSGVSATATLEIADTTVFNDSTSGTVKVGDKTYNLADYQNVEELADDISNNKDVSSVTGVYDYTDKTVKETSGPDGIQIQAGASTISAAKYDSMQSLSFAIESDGKSFAAGDYITDVAGKAVTIGLTATDTVDSAATKMGRALQDAFGENNVTIDGNEFEVKIAADKSTFSVTAAKEATELEFDLQVGAESGDDNKIGVSISSMNSESLGLAGLKVATKKTATDSIDTIADAIKMVSKQRSALGAVQNRLEHTISNLDNVVENTTSAESRIRDVDMASEMVKYSKNNILQQAGTSMLAQANQSTQGILSLLQ